MGRIGSTEMYLILDKFGITVMFLGLILITGSICYTKYLLKRTSQFRSPEEIQPDLTVQSASRAEGHQQSKAAAGRLRRFPSDLLESSVDPQPSAAAGAEQAAQAAAAAAHEAVRPTFVPQAAQAPAAQAENALYQAAEGKYGCGIVWITPEDALQFYKYFRNKKKIYEYGMKNHPGPS